MVPLALWPCSFDDVGRVIPLGDCISFFKRCVENSKRMDGKIVKHFKIAEFLGMFHDMSFLTCVLAYNECKCIQL